MSVPAAAETLKRIERGLRLVTVPMPHLAGLASAVRVEIDDRVPTMGVFASGRMVANRQFVAKLKESELVFVLAHELLHLALRTHDRAKGSGRLEFNYAHDYIINDILRAELGFTHVPAGGLDMPGAREKSAERIVLEMRKRGDEIRSRTKVWDGEAASARGALGQQQSGEGEVEAGDVLDDARERQLFPQAAREQAAKRREMEDLAAKSLALAKAMEAMKGMGQDAGGQVQAVEALRGLYRTPWETALQKWLESVAPGERTYLRPARRESGRADVVLPGRKRESWMLNVVLDTSGSMTDVLPRALGAIAHFCDAVSVDNIRVVQCDSDVTADDVLSAQELSSFQATGFGGSDLSPAMRMLAEDPRVTAVLVVTDGDIAYPPEEMPYRVLWVLAPGHGNFRPRYGHAIAMTGAGQ
jgi:predicted metal-dependent peptidase